MTAAVPATFSKWFADKGLRREAGMAGWQIGGIYYLPETFHLGFAAEPMT